MTREELQEPLDEHDRKFGKPEDPLTKWKREADERDAEIAAEREKEQRERERAQRRAQREAAESWDAHINNLIESRDETNIQVSVLAAGALAQQNLLLFLPSAVFYLRPIQQ